ncbi:unnamed protein product [Leptidea sinapis]|uniref:Centromere protein I n=1 Tax=Leptidea sinapis TaxID=189913 RepID=A0A5E4PSB5_9NEOP|nr:unnamed protein product [Leptidea sinapis]
MSDVSEILHYMKSLRKGFDKSLFESKIEELCDVVMIAGLNSDDFHSLFTVWLNLSIPIKNWTSLGLCIVPQEIVGQKSVEYALRWLLEINKSCNDFPRIAFLLDWLTAFLDVSPHSMEEKKQFLELLAIFQSTVMQGLSVITSFLAKFLPHWNEKDYFMQILALIEWLHVESHEQVRVILDTLTKVYCRAHPIQQCAILNSVTKAYTNLVYASTRKRHFFLNVQPPENSYTEMIELVAYKINEICSKGLQTNPEDMRVMLGSVSSLRRCVRMELLVCGPVVSTPALLTVALPLISTSALAIDMIADLLLMYKKIFSAIKAKYGRRDEKDIDKMKMLKAFTSDIVSCFQEQFITNRSEGIIFSNIQPNIIKKLTYLVPDADSKLSFRNHVAFAPYTSMRHEQMIDEIDHKSLFDAKIAQAFVHLGRFVELSMPKFSK